MGSAGVAVVKAVGDMIGYGVPLGSAAVGVVVVWLWRGCVLGVGRGGGSGGGGYIWLVAD